MAMKYTCDTCPNTVWISGFHSMGLVKFYPRCHKCGGKMVMPGKKYIGR